VKDIFNKNYKPMKKQIEEKTLKYGTISHDHKLAKLVL
jgi:hypothetical protein